MIKAVRPRKKKASVRSRDPGLANARRGGGPSADSGESNAPKTNQLDGRLSVTGPRNVEPAAGDNPFDPDLKDVSRKNKGRSNDRVSPIYAVSDQIQAADGGDIVGAYVEGNASICRQLQELQRQKATFLKSRIMIDNRLTANVSTMMGYSAGMEEKERKAVRAEAETLIAALAKGKPVEEKWANIAQQIVGVVASVQASSNGFDTFLGGVEKEMSRLAKQLPAAAWINDTDRRGFGILSLATVIGETGDLSLYANPAKVWKRLGLAPFQGKMPSTWRRCRDGKLSAEQWTEIGYSPRRRSIMFVVGENIVKQNKGSYRKRYDEAKAAAHVNHADWSNGRCHWHGMLLATKRLVLDLWKEWNRQ